MMRRGTVRLARMRTLAVLLALSLVVPVGSATPVADEPAAKAAPEASKKSSPARDQPTPVSEAPRPVDPPLPDKAPSPEELPPTVTIRNVKGAVIEEYRQGTRLYMIRVVPERGVAYEYIDTDGNGRLEYDGEDGPVRPVYYTLYEWD